MDLRTELEDLNDALIDLRYKELTGDVLKKSAKSLRRTGWFKGLCRKGK